MRARGARALLVGLGWNLATAVPASAQSAAQRAVIQAFRDSIDRTIDSAGLARLETRLVSTVRAGGGPEDHLRLGFLGLRLGELGSERGYEDAAMEFRSVTLLAAAWPFGWYGLGLAEFLLSTVPVPGALVLDPARFRERAAAAFARSAGTDPTFAPILVQEAHAGRSLRQPQRSAVALEALRKAAGSSGGALVLQGLGQVEREYGDPAAALRAFEAALPLASRNRGFGLLEVARTRFLLGRPDGDVPYYLGAAMDDSGSVAGYREDLALIATPADLRRFDATNGPRRVEFLRQFWRSRDLVEFRADGERLREHYRRVFVARRGYPRSLPGKRFGEPRTIAIGSGIDDRGVILVRHGEPDDRVNLNTLGFEPNESWRYIRAEGDLLLHFVARQRSDEFLLVESLFDVADALASSTTFEPERMAGDQMLLRSRERLSPIYNMTGRTEGDRARRFELAERAAGRASLQTALTSDSHRQRFGRQLPVTSSLTLLGRVGDRTEAFLAYEVPFAATGGSWLGEGIAYPLRLRFVALTGNGEAAVQLDSLVRPTALLRQGERILIGVAKFTLPDGPLQVRASFEDGSRGTIRGLVEVHPAPATPGGFTLSDLVVAPTTSPWQATVAGIVVALDARGDVRRNQPTDVIVELQRSTTEQLECRLLVIRIDDSPAIAYQEQWTEAGSTPSQLIRRLLDPGRLRAGLYRAEVTVRSPTGQLVRRTREFAVR